MTSDTDQIVRKTWNFAHVLRHDGRSYIGYTEQITFLLRYLDIHEDDRLDEAQLADRVKQASQLPGERM